MNEPRLQGRVAIVTGAGAALKPGDGIGDAITLLFARHGGRVAVLDIDEARATATAAEIEREGGEALIVVADVTHRNDCQRAVEETHRHFGAVNVLVNNAESPAARTSRTSTKRNGIV